MSDRLNASSDTLHRDPCLRAVAMHLLCACVRALDMLKSESNQLGSGFQDECNLGRVNKRRAECGQSTMKAIHARERV